MAPVSAAPLIIAAQCTQVLKAASSLPCLSVSPSYFSKVLPALSEGSLRRVLLCRAQFLRLLLPSFSWANTPAVCEDLLSSSRLPTSPPQQTSPAPPPQCPRQLWGEDPTLLGHAGSVVFSLRAQILRGRCKRSHILEAPCGARGCMCLFISRFLHSFLLGLKPLASPEHQRIPVHGGAPRLPRAALSRPFLESFRPPRPGNGYKRDVACIASASAAIFSPPASDVCLCVGTWLPAGAYSLCY